MDTNIRRAIYTLMIVLSVGQMLARIANVENVFEPSLFKANPTRVWPKDRPEPFPSFGSNDRARWATVKAIVENGTFVIGERIADPTAAKKYRDEGILFTDGYKSVDNVKNPETDKFFATKPPLFTVAVAGEYWLLHKLFGWQISEDKWEVVVTVLITFNVLPLALGLLLLSRLIEEYGTTDWGRLFTFAVACFGTFLTTFAITLNNHTPATCCILFALYALNGPRSAGRLIGAGLLSGFALCLDLPSASFAGMVAFVLLLQSWKSLLWFVPAVLVAPAIQTTINYQVFDTVVPIYAKFGGPWYKYDGSHWSKQDLVPPPAGIDFIDEPKWKYARNLLVGHHGLFSLTPVWLLSILGFCWLRRENDRGIWAIMRWMPVVLLVVIGYYIFKTNNYGGWTSGPRWLFWLTPVLLLSLLPMADGLAHSQTGRASAYLALGVSVFSVTYPWANPWRHPWIYQLGEYLEWVRY